MYYISVYSYREKLLNDLIDYIMMDTELVGCLAQELVASVQQLLVSQQISSLVSQLANCMPDVDPYIDDLFRSEGKRLESDKMKGV